MGIIFNIPTKFSDFELKEYISSPVPIQEIIRVKTKDRDNKDIFNNTPRVKILFKGTQIPNEIVFLYTKINVSPFVPFSQCFRCFRFKHFAQHCKQTEQKCSKCSLSHSREQQCSQLVCTNCKQNHSATSLECPARKGAYAIQKCMTLENLSRNETKIRYPSLFQLLDEVDTNDLNHFPQPTWQRKSAIPVLQNNTKIATQQIFAQNPFNKVVKNSLSKKNEEKNSRDAMIS